MENNLKRCLEAIKPAWKCEEGDLNINFTGVKLDSRQVGDGDVFIAIKGGNVDGHKFILSAIKQGAAAVVGTEDSEQWAALTVPYIQVQEPRPFMAELAAAFYDFPARKMTIIGVTGTDGKTTTSNMLYELLRYAGVKVGMVSTVNAKIGDVELDTGFHVTTPEAPDVQLYLYKMHQAGLTHVVLETTSHGLAQDRVTGCAFDIGVVTNITHEHLDYHGDYQHYFDAKARLFDFLSEREPKGFDVAPLAVLNQDDQSFRGLLEHTQVNMAAYSIEGESDIWADAIRFTPDGTRFVVHGRDFSVDVLCRIAGIFNVSNVLAAMGAAIYGLGIAPEVAAAGISQLAAVPGRMEMISIGQDFMAVVDFAHTPNALKRALQTAKEMVSGRVIAVFGSAGLRDREKRRMMAEISAEAADVTILTAEDPRIESLDGILAEMQGAAELKGAVLHKNLFVVPDRGAAIALGAKMAEKDDILMACGKGHEQSMCFGTTEYLWDDRTAMRAALAALLDVDGPEMPYLPTQD